MHRYNTRYLSDGVKIEACEYRGSREYGGLLIEQPHCDARKIYAIKELCLLFVFLLSVRLFIMHGATFGI